MREAEWQRRLGEIVDNEVMRELTQQRMFGQLQNQPENQQPIRPIPREQRIDSVPVTVSSNVGGRVVCFTPEMLQQNQTTISNDSPTAADLGLDEVEAGPELVLDPKDVVLGRLADYDGAYQHVHRWRDLVGIGRARLWQLRFVPIETPETEGLTLPKFAGARPCRGEWCLPPRIPKPVAKYAHLKALGRADQNSTWIALGGTKLLEWDDWVRTIRGMLPVEVQDRMCGPEQFQFLGRVNA